MIKRLLVAIMVLSAFLRFFDLGNIPLGFTPDEASFGYDAYSLIKTGKDQWGVGFPIVFKSFGDYKSPLLTYLQIPFVAILGLTKTVVRLPNALIGFFAVLATFLLIRELFKDKFKIESWKLGICGAYLVGISSWHIMMSRGAFEASLPTFFIPLGFYFFLKGLKQIKYMNLSALIFGLNLFTYHSSKLVTPLLIAILIAFYWSSLKKINFKKLVPSFLIILFFFCLMFYSLKLGSGIRINERSIFQGALEEGAKVKIALIQQGTNPIIARLMHNKYQVVVKRFITNYTQYFSYRFLFLKGPAEATYGMIPGNGVLYPFELLFILGIFLAFINKTWKKEISLVFLWLLISPIPAAMATGVGYSANRAVTMIPAIYILLVFGGYNLYIFIKNKLPKSSKYVLGSFIIISLISFVIFINNYFFKESSILAKSMLSGNLEMVSWLKENSDGYSKIIVSRRLSEPHIYLAFGQKLDPKMFQIDSKDWDLDKANVSWVDQIPEYKLTDYTFRNIEWKEDSKLQNTLFVGKPEEFPLGIESKKVFYYPDNGEAIIIVSSK